MSNKVQLTTHRVSQTISFLKRVSKNPFRFSYNAGEYLRSRDSLSLPPDLGVASWSSCEDDSIFESSPPINHRKGSQKGIDEYCKKY